MYQYKTKAFTLVELIVVITILAILGTIAFISLQWYSKDSRDSVRINDISKLKITLELFSLDAWKYPSPDNSENITYSWWEIIWNQWEIWENVVTNLSRNLSEIPIDPLTDKKYVYSTLNNKKEYEILSIYESDNITSIVSQANAELWAFVRIDGTYNGLYVRDIQNCKIVWLPSIITSEDLSSWPVILDETTIDSQIITWWSNRLSYWKIKTLTWLLDINFSIYEWCLGEEISLWIWLDIYNTLSNTYSGTSLENIWKYKQIFENSSDNEKLWFVSDLLHVDNNWYVCNDLTKPVDNWHIFYTSNPTSANQAYVQGSLECWYSCLDDYVWSNCEIAPVSCDESTKPVDNGHISYTNNPTSANQTYVQGSSECWYSCLDNYLWSDCSKLVSLHKLYDDTSESENENQCAYMSWNGSAYGCIWWSITYKDVFNPGNPSYPVKTCDQWSYVATTLINGSLVISNSSSNLWESCKEWLERIWEIN